MIFERYLLISCLSPLAAVPHLHRETTRIPCDDVTVVAQLDSLDIQMIKQRATSFRQVFFRSYVGFGRWLRLRRSDSRGGGPASSESAVDAQPLSNSSPAVSRIIRRCIPTAPWAIDLHASSSQNFARPCQAFRGHQPTPCQAHSHALVTGSGMRGLRGSRGGAASL